MPSIHSKVMLEPSAKARFIAPMLLLRTERLPEGALWAYELKLDGYGALAIKSSGLRSIRQTPRRRVHQIKQRDSQASGGLLGWQGARVVIPDDQEAVRGSLDPPHLLVVDPFPST
jgi:hypothetical protein